MRKLGIADQEVEAVAEVERRELERDADQVVCALLRAARGNEQAAGG